MDLLDKYEKNFFYIFCRILPSMLEQMKLKSEDYDKFKRDRAQVEIL